MLVHVSEVDGIIENSHPPLASPAAETDELDRKIAGYIADLVPDGSCVQFGLGGLANAIGSNLAYAGKKDLGIQSEVISSCVVDLMKKGVINNSRKQTFPGRAVGTYFIGDEELWKFAGNNPLFTHKEIDWTNDSRRIAQNDNVVSINNAMEVDLTGQVNAESIGARQFSGTGGQLEWVIGSQWSKGGKSIIALRSTYTDRSGTLHSKIHAELPLGSIVTTPRTWVQYVVTEYGVADLKYKTTHDRAKALINIAHPDFREELRRKMPL
jgi:4-hydroxybutyrate CoA-transferase